MLIRPLDSVYFRRRDIVVTIGMALLVPLFIYFAQQDGWSKQDGVAFVLFGVFLTVTRTATLLIDASLRRRTRYELQSGTLQVIRDGKLVKSIRLSELDRLSPDSVDSKGRGSAELPHIPLSDIRALSKWKVFIPAIYAGAELSVVPDVVQLCARIRAEAKVWAASELR